MTRSANQSGFSLIEVMVAILILGIAVAGLTGGVTTALSSSKESELQTTAALLAAGRIETLRAEGTLLDGVTDGDFGAGLPLYRWTQTISPSEPDGLHDVDVAVNDSRSGLAIYDLRTLIFETPQDTNTNAAGGSKGPNGRPRPGGSE
jgi:general secretion pathway protein I